MEKKIPASNRLHYTPNSRRNFLKQSSALAALTLLPAVAAKAHNGIADTLADKLEQQNVTMEINGKSYEFSIEPRTTILDLLREKLHLTGTKKGCDWGQCGACTIHINGRRVLSCMSLAIMHNGDTITTIEGIGTEEKLHPMQEAFIKYDGFQCGYCTPGQIMSAISCIKEDHANSDAEIQEYMSGNICRCGAYNNITAAIKEVKKGGQQL
jgi:xanthine dehydrogenase YagT iron-sulfur-binding subunit